MCGYVDRAQCAWTPRVGYVRVCVCVGYYAGWDEGKELDAVYVYIYTYVIPCACTYILITYMYHRVFMSGTLHSARMDGVSRGNASHSQIDLSSLHTHTQIHTHTHTLTHTHTHIHIYTHTHIHT